MIHQLDYVKPDVVDFVSCNAEGGSCYVDCNSDDICPGEVDEI